MKSALFVILVSGLAIAGIYYLKQNAENPQIPTNYNECRHNTKSQYNEITCSISYEKGDPSTTACLDTGGCVQNAVGGSGGCTMKFFNPNATLPTNNLECTKVRRGRNAENLDTVTDLGTGCELNINTACAGNLGEGKAIIDKCPELHKETYRGYGVCNLKYY